MLRKIGASNGTMRTLNLVLFSLLGAVVFFAAFRFDSLDGIPLDGILFVGVFVVALLVILRYRRNLLDSEEKFREGENLFKNLINNAADAMYVVSLSGEILEANRRACEDLGYSRDELVGLFVEDIEVDFESFSDEWERLLSGETVTVVGAHRRKDGTAFPVEGRSTMFEVDGTKYLMSIARDVGERNEMVEEMRTREERSRAILDAIPDLVFRFHRGGEVLDVKAHEVGRLRIPHDVVGRNLKELLPEKLCAKMLDGAEAAIFSGETGKVEIELPLEDGELHFDVRIVASGEDEAVCFARDVTEQNRAIEDLRRSEARNRAMIEAIPDLVIRFDGSGRYLDFHAHEDFETIVTSEDLIGRSVEDVMPPDAARSITRAISTALEAGETQCVELHVPGGGGERHREARLVKSGDDEVTCFVRDIGERVEFESRITRLAYHDELTNLPNRAAFMEKLAEAVAGSDRTAVVVLSLRGFSKINDSLGRETGDRLLALVARRLVDCFGGGGEVARFDGDEFAVLVKGYGDLGEVLDLIEKGQRIYPNTPFTLDETEVFLRGSVGVAEADGGDDADSVVRKASVALLEAKEDSDADYKIYDEDMGERAVARIHLERDLRLALEYGHLEVYYQPEIFLSSGRIYSLEALARWNHPEHGYISPAVFIPLAEESGLIMRLGEYVLEEACLRMRLWRERLPEAAPCSVSVNISAVQLRRRDLPRKISRILRENEIEPEALQLEITESAAMEDLESCRDIFSELRELGVRVALDDFGTGYSSLSCLRRFPLDSLKVDRSFVSTLEDDPQMANVVGSIIELAHALDLEVISEGVETPGQLSTLRRLGCDVGQGYHFSRPLPPDEALDLLASWQTLDLLDGAG